MNILIVEDQQRLAQALKTILEDEHHHVDAVGDGVTGLDYAQLGTYDAIVLDVMLPRMDGYEVVRQLRRSDNAVPVLLLTARDTLRDKVHGLDLGADDYLTKPFQPAELLARLRAISRRQGDVVVETLTVGNTTLDLQTADLTCPAQKVASATDAGATASATDAAGVAAGAITADAPPPKAVHLSQREFEVCKLLMANANQTIPKQTLLTRVWGLDASADENSVEAYVSFLRKKLGYLDSNLAITTLRMLGYRLEVVEDAHAH